MTLYEYAGNLHIHTPYSDGTDYHAEIAQAARKAGLDFIIVTDHNLYVHGVEGYYGDEKAGYVLLLVGQEIHDRTRLPQVNHCLVYNTGRELCQHAKPAQHLLDTVAAYQGLSFLAHPHDTQVPFLNPFSDGIAIPWVDWEVQGYTGLEIWNYLSGWKETLRDVPSTLRSIRRPAEHIIGPNPQTLAHWDALLAQGQQVVGIGNADAHGMWVQVGPIKRRLFSYEFVFRCVNTHILTPRPWEGDAQADQAMIYEALAAGRAFIAYDLISPSRGFRFSAQGRDQQVVMGGTIPLKEGVTLQIKAPLPGQIKLIRHGQVLCDDYGDTLTYTASQPGAYRVEIWREYKAQRRCWILSNPIYITPS
jgi:hypothetical protein